MDGAAPDDNIDALPLEQRLTHKVRTEEGRLAEAVLTTGIRPCPQVWKARLSAYTEIASLAAKTADDSDPLFREYYITNGASLREWVHDANAVAQEKGVEAACAVVEYGGRTATRQVGVHTSVGRFRIR